MSDSDISSDLLRDALSRFSGHQATSITAESGGGAVRVRLRGLEAVESVTIDPEAAADVPLLEELIAAAMNDAFAQARAANQEVALGLLAQLGQD